MATFSKQIETASIAQLQQWQKDLSWNPNNQNYKAVVDQLAKLQSATPAATNTSIQAKVDAFNAAFSQPSLLAAPTLDAAVLSPGDQLALSTQYATPTPQATWSGNTEAPTSRTIDQQNADFEAFMSDVQTTPQVTAFGDTTAVNQAKQAELQNNMNTIATQQAAQSAQDAVRANVKAATTGIDLGKATTEDTLRTRIRRGIASTIATKGTLSSPLLEKPTLLG